MVTASAHNLAFFFIIIVLLWLEIAFVAPYCRFFWGACVYAAASVLCGMMYYMCVDGTCNVVV